MRREVTDGVVAPVVAQPPLQQMVLVRVLVHRQQLDRRHPEPHQMLDRRRVREPRVGAPQLFGDPRMELGEATHMQFVDDRVRPRRLGPAVVHPFVVGGVIVDDDALGHMERRVPVVAHGVRDVLLRPVPYVSVHLRWQVEVPVHRACVRIEQQLRRIPAGARPRVPAAVHPVAVPLTRLDPGHEAVPDLMRQLGQRQPCLRGRIAPVVEETQLDRLRTARPEREVGPRHPVRTDPETGTERRRRPRPHRWPAGSGLPVAAARPGRRKGAGQVAPHPLLHCLLLGCARHLPASRGSSGPAGGTSHARRALGSAAAHGVPAAAAHAWSSHLFCPRCSCPNMALLSRFPWRGWSLGGT